MFVTAVIILQFYCNNSEYKRQGKQCLSRAAEFLEKTGVWKPHLMLYTVNLKNKNKKKPFSLKEKEVMGVFKKKMQNVAQQSIQIIIQILGQQFSMS